MKREIWIEWDPLWIESFMSRHSIHISLFICIGLFCRSLFICNVLYMNRIIHVKTWVESRDMMDSKSVHTLFLDSLNRVPSQSTHGGDQTQNIWISRFAWFPGVLLHWWGTVYWRGNLFEILGTPEKTCLICIGTPVKTCWELWHS